LGWGQAFKLNGFYYPKHWLELAPAEDIAAIGLIPYTPETPPPPPPPEEVEPAVAQAEKYPLTRKQLRIGLLQAGISEANVLAAIDAMPDPMEKALAKIEWEDAHEYQFDHPLVQTLTAGFGIDDATLRTVWMAVKDIP
jgi:hypothetical protein